MLTAMSSTNVEDVRWVDGWADARYTRRATGLRVHGLQFLEFCQCLSFSPRAFQWGGLWATSRSFTMIGVFARHMCTLRMSLESCYRSPASTTSDYITGRLSNLLQCSLCGPNDFFPDSGVYYCAIQLTSRMLDCYSRRSRRGPLRTANFGVEVENSQFCTGVEGGICCFWLSTLTPKINLLTVMLFPPYFLLDASLALGLSSSIQVVARWIRRFARHIGTLTQANRGGSGTLSLL